jgi:RNA polymerase sigma factor (sigma-70 family)
VALLSSRFELFDIVDVERFAGRIVERSGLALSHHDREDLVASLVVACWECSDSYDPERGSFSTFATYRLRSEVTAWLRTSNERCGRTGFVGGRTVWKFRNRVYERPQRVLVSLDGADRDLLAATLGEGDGDSEADRDEVVRGLFEARDRHRARDLELLGYEGPEIAA